MMETPGISIIGPSYRPENWMDLYRSIGDNDVSFEIIFVGPNEPDFKLPDNFKFIKSDVKPEQCFEIAARNATADLIMNIADDVEFRTNRPMDRLYNTYKSYNNDKLILSCRYMLDGEDLSEDSHHFIQGDISSPVMPLSGLMSSKLYREIGGIDRNFIAIMGESDLAMRVHAMGGEVILSDVYLEENKRKSRGSMLCNEFWGHDRGLLEELWLVNGKVQFHRSRNVEPFSDFRILEQSQGPRGRWGGSSPVGLEKLTDFYWNFCWHFYWQRISVFSRAFRTIKNIVKFPEYAKKIFRRNQ